MKRIAKIVILAAVLVGIALGGQVQASEGGQFTAAEYSTYVDSEQISENVWSNGIRSFACSLFVNYGLMTGPSSVLSLGPSYTGCTGNGNTTATVNSNGCTYTLAVTTQVSATTGNATTAIDCTAGLNLTVDIWATGKTHAEGKLCRLVIPPQTITGLTYHNVTMEFGRKAVEVTVASSNVKILRTEGTAVNCGAAEKTNGTYNGNLRLIAGLGGIDFWVD